jgi:hypothetical protein
MKFSLAVKDFSIWLPEADDLPSVSFLPIALRKKLSPLTKIACYLLNDLTVKSNLNPESIRLVLSSRFGEADNTIQLLRSIKEEEPTSPMAFSRSVHNSALGIFSIATKNRTLSSSVAGGKRSVSAGLTEAMVQLYSNPELEVVVLVHVDEKMPEEYHPVVNEPLSSYGFGCVLVRSEDSLDVEFKDAKDEADSFMEFLLRNNL